MHDQPRLYSTAEVADRLGVTAPHVRYLIRRYGVGRRLGRDWFLTEADIERLEQRRRTPGPIPTLLPDMDRGKIEEDDSSDERGAT